MARVSVAGQDVKRLRGGKAVAAGLLGLVIGLAAVGLGYMDYQEQTEILDNAVSVNATITETSVETTSSGGSGINYRPEIVFEYSFEGENYTGDHFYPSEITRNYDNRGSARGYLDSYETGGTVEAFVDPEQPDDAFLEAERSSSPLVFMVGGAVIALGSIYSVTMR